VHKLEAEAASRLGQAERRQTDAAAVVEQARQQAASLLQEAATERQRLDSEAAQTRATCEEAAAQQRAALQEESRLAWQAAEAAAAARVMAAQQQLQSLLRRQDEVHQHLRDLTGHLDTALRALQAESAPGFSFADNQAADVGGTTTAPKPERARPQASPA
jgi:hypothetical protein